MKQYLRHLVLLLAAVIGSFVFLNLFARVDFNLEAFHAGMSMRLSTHGETVLKVPPVGEVKARTHKTPLKIVVSLEEIDLDGLNKMLAGAPEQNRIFSDAKNSVMAAARKFVFVVLALGFSGGLFGVLVIHRKRPWEFIAGGITGLAVVSLLLLGTYSTFDTEQFQNPEYEGIIKAAPWMIGLVQDSFVTVNKWGKQLRGIANNLYGLFERVESLQAMAPGDGNIKILHVSDIHNNPAAFEFIDQVVRTFGVTVVIDSGDISDFGTPIEAVALEKLRSLTVPYVFVPGNHETPAIITELKKIPNVLVLEGGLQEINGLRIAGIADPSSRGSDFHAPEQPVIDEFVGKLQAIIDSSNVDPDIAVAHNPKIASAFWGKVPVVLTGHDHKYKIKTKGNSVLIDAGSSGASGIGGFKSREDNPYSFVLLHFDKTGDGVRLKYTDTIRISNLQSGYSLERKVYQNP